MAVRCIQPISYAPVPGIAPVVNAVDGRSVYLIPLVGEVSTDVAPVEADTACDPQAAFLPYVSEVELERLNLVRTSDAVLWKKLVDVGIRLAGADKVTLDGAGRITTWTGLRRSHPRSTHPPIRPPSTRRQRVTPRRRLRRQTGSPGRGNQVA